MHQLGARGQVKARLVKFPQNLPCSCLSGKIMFISTSEFQRIEMHDLE